MQRLSGGGAYTIDNRTAMLIAQHGHINNRRNCMVTKKWVLLMNCITVSYNYSYMTMHIL